jgi:hypothetical protein
VKTMPLDPEYAINKFLCEQCQHFDRYNLDYHIVSDAGVVESRVLQKAFGLCEVIGRCCEGREYCCQYFKK